MSEHQYLNPFLALPRTGALFFSGSAFYIGFVDPFVRDSLRNPRAQLTHWGTMFRWSSVIMLGIAAGTGASALKAYEVSKEPMWLIGGLAMMSVVPYTALFLRPLNNELLHEDKYTGAEIDISKRDGVIASLKKWVKLHRVRLLISLTAAFIFYVAEGESSGGSKGIQVDIEVKWSVW